MKTDGAIRTDIYKHLRDKSLCTAVTGVLSKTGRPAKSEKEDVVISIVSNEGIQEQIAIVNVNVYVKDYDVDGHFEENTIRVEELCELAWNDMESFRTDDYCVHAVSQRVYATDAGEHVINNRLEYKLIND